MPGPSSSNATKLSANLCVTASAGSQHGQHAPHSRIMSGPSTFPEPERQAGGLLCCIPARPGVLGTTFLGMFFSGVLTSMLWIEVASACSSDRVRE